MSITPPATSVTHSSHNSIYDVSQYDLAFQGDFSLWIHGLLLFLVVLSLA